MGRRPAHRVGGPATSPARTARHPLAPAEPASAQTASRSLSRWPEGRKPKDLATCLSQALGHPVPLDTRWDRGTAPASAGAPRTLSQAADPHAINLHQDTGHARARERPSTVAVQGRQRRKTGKPADARGRRALSRSLAPPRSVGQCGAVRGGREPQGRGGDRSGSPAAAAASPWASGTLRDLPAQPEDPERRSAGGRGGFGRLQGGVLSVDSR